MTDLVASAARFPVPRAVTWREKSAALQVWGPHLFILPHVLAGVGLIAAMLGSLLWILLGTTTQAEVQRTSSSKTRKGTICSVTWAGPRGGRAGLGDSLLRPARDALAAGGGRAGAVAADVEDCQQVEGPARRYLLNDN